VLSQRFDGGSVSSAGDLRGGRYPNFFARSGWATKSNRPTLDASDVMFSNKSAQISSIGCSLNRDKYLGLSTSQPGAIVVNTSDQVIPGSLAGERFDPNTRIPRYNRIPDRGRIGKTSRPHPFYHFKVARQNPESTSAIHRNVRASDCGPRTRSR